MSTSNETRKRKRLKKMLGAEVVTSKDLGGHRRFKCAVRGLWGYCLDDGTVIRMPEFEEARHFCAPCEAYVVKHFGRTRFFTKDWVEVDQWDLDFGAGL